MADHLAGPELWISLVIGLLLIGVGRHFPQYLFDELTGRTYHTGVTFIADNSEVPYPQVEGFVMLTDAAIFSFGLALLCDAGLRALSLGLNAKGGRAAIAVAFSLTLVATLFNAGVAMKLLAVDIMPLISGVAVAFGGYIAFEQWQTIRSIK